MPRYPKPNTQAAMVLQVLLDADGRWVSKQVFLRELFLTQAGARIFELENKYGWLIEHSKERDELGFVSYRIVQEPTTMSLLQ